MPNSQDQQLTYQLLIKALEDNKWKYDEDEDHVIYTYFMVDDMRCSFMMHAGTNIVYICMFDIYSCSRWDAVKVGRMKRAVNEIIAQTGINMSTRQRDDDEVYVRLDWYIPFTESITTRDMMLSVTLERMTSCAKMFMEMMEEDGGKAPTETDGKEDQT